MFRIITVIIIHECSFPGTSLTEFKVDILGIVFVPRRFSESVNLADMNELLLPESINALVTCRPLILTLTAGSIEAT